MLDQPEPIMFALDNRTGVEHRLIPAQDYELAVRELNAAREWAIEHGTPSDHHIRCHIEWALVALGQDIPN